MKRCFPSGSVLSSTLLALIVALLAQTAAYAAGGGEHGGAGKAEWIDFAWRMLNFAILVGFLYWFLAKKIKDFFSGRRADIKTSLEQAQVAKKRLRRTIRPCGQAGQGTEEIDGIVRNDQAQGMKEKVKIIEDAEKAAGQIEEGHRARMEHEFKNASISCGRRLSNFPYRWRKRLLKRSYYQRGT
jgi:F-type H+-transporting ATPase subunit b